MSMVTGNARAATEAAGVGTLLRVWRERRRYSQLELSHRADVSTRHLSYVETGRSRPTAEMILRLAEQLNVPLSDRNRLLLAGGYAPRYTSASLHDDSLATVMAGLRRLLDAHMPWPALLLDEQWDIVDANGAAEALLEGCDPPLLEPPVNAVRVSVHPRGLARRNRNLPQWAAHLRHQVRHRAEHTGDPKLWALVAEIDSFVDLPDHVESPRSPVLPLELDAGNTVLRFFSVAARLETPTDTTLEGLHLETFIPADAATSSALPAPHEADVRATESAP